MLFSLAMIPPLVISLVLEDGLAVHFFHSFGIILSIGFGLWLPNNSQSANLRNRDAFLVTAIIYVVLGLGGSLPFYLADHVSSWTDAGFESFSGLTTTGATVLSGLDGMPRSLVFYRQELQWLGGMGIIVLAVAILPMIGVGGMQLFRAEIPSPNKDNKLTPRITETARSLWKIYLTITFICAGAYYLAGMSLFDAICHSFSTVAVGGFSTHDLSIGWFNSPAIEWVCIFFMVLCSVNFSLHYLAWSRKNPLSYFGDAEVRFFTTTLFLGFCLVFLANYLLGSSESSVRETMFQTVSIASTTGFAATDFSIWPPLSLILLFLLAFIGGCSGSTAGGMKAVRVNLIILQGIREIRKLIHPKGVYFVKLGDNSVDEQMINSVWGFFSIYIFLVLVMTILLMFLNVDFLTALSTVSASVTNLGPALGEAAVNYASLPDIAKWTLMFAMLLGRLEVFTVLVLFTVTFWRR